MPPLDEQKILKQVQQLFKRWNAPRSIMWLSDPRQELFRTCPELNIECVNAAMAKFVEKGGVPNRVKETMPSLVEMGKDSFYEFRIRVDGIEVYVKGRIMDGPQFYVIRFHRDWK